MNDEITKARTFAKVAHAGQKYGAGDYFEDHVFKVATRVLNDPDATFGHMAVAYLHDVVEDTSVTVEDLIAMGFSSEVVAAVDRMTRKPGPTYNEYVAGIASDKSSFAWLVKYHDINENLSNSTTPSMVARYTKALEIMEA